jgi:tRNA-binding protein
MSHGIAWSNHAVGSRSSARSRIESKGVAAEREGRDVVAMATVDDFLTLDIRVGTVIAAEPFPEARKPAVKLRIDFGPQLGVKKSSAQLTVHYTPEQLVGRQVVAVVNFPLRRIAGFESEVLVLGAMPTEREVVLLAVDRAVDDGTRIG